MISVFNFFMKRHPYQIATMSVLLMVAGILEVMGVATLLPIMNTLLNGTTSDNNFIQAIRKIFTFADIDLSLASLLCFMVICVFLRGMLSLFAFVKVSSITVDIISELRNSLISACTKAKWPYYIDLSPAKVQNAISYESSHFSTICVNICRIISDAFLVILYLSFSYVIAKEVMFISVAISLIIMVILYPTIKITYKASRLETKTFQALLTKILNALTSIKSIKSMGREDHYTNLLAIDVRKIARAQKKKMFNGHLLSLSREPIIITFIALYLYANVVYAQVPVVDLLVLSAFFLRTAMKITHLQAHYRAIADQETAFFSFKNLLEDIENNREGLSGYRSFTLNKGIQIKDLCFSHTRDNITLSHVSHFFGANKLHIIRGKSGSGKTTLIDILLGFYKPDSGRILIDHEDFSQINISKWRHSVGYVGQENVLLNDSIYKNITFGDEKISEKQVTDALKKANIYDFVSSLPNGIYENVGESGQKLSGGQKQRLIIARAIVRKPLLLLLDEPTSALDEESSHKIMQEISKMRDDMTIIIITHDQTLDRYADDVSILQKGELRTK